MLKTSIDLTSKYLVLSDIWRKCFYVLHIHADVDNNVASCTAISEFILAYPAISYAIIDSQQIKTKKYNQLNNVTTQNTGASLGHHNSDFDLNSNENSLTQNDLINTSLSSNSISNSNSTLTADNSENDLVTMIKLYCIQTKQLQEMQIFLSGDQSVNAYNNNSVSPPPPLPTLSQQLLTPTNAVLTTSSLPIGPKSNSSSTSSILQQLLPNISSNKRLNSDKLG